MLTLTENATMVVQAITEQSSESGQGGEAGLRIATDETAPLALSVAPAEAPEAGDAIVEEGAARVFLEQNAALVLDDKTLDAAVDEKGAVQFSIIQQAQPTA